MRRNFKSFNGNLFAAVMVIGAVVSAAVPEKSAPHPGSSSGRARADVGSPYPTGLSDQSITVSGTARQYRVYVPESLYGAPKAVVLVLHGGGGTGSNVAEAGTNPLAAFRDVADREGFVVVYPAGLPARDGRPGWNDCRSDDKVSSGADDVAFLAALIERVLSQYGLSSDRVFMAGGSNGAMMTHAFAISRPELLAGAATSSGSLAANPKSGPCEKGPASPLPILIVHGTGDTQMPYSGGCVANLGGSCNRGRVIAAEATRDRWLQANGLAGIVPDQEVVERDSGDAGPANRFDYPGPVPLRWWRLDGAGHTVASRSVPLASNRLTGIQNRDVEFAEIAWEFFRERLPAINRVTAEIMKPVTESGAYRVTRSIGTASLSVPAILDKPVGDTLDVMLLFHGTVGYDSLVLDAARNTLDAFSALFDRRDFLLVSVAYPEEGLLMGDNVRHAEAALIWVRERAERELGIKIRRVFIAGHSQGGYIAIRLNTLHTVDGVIASAPGPLDLVFRCTLEENGRLAAGEVCSLLRKAYGSTRDASQAYWARSLLEFTGNQRSPLLVVQGLSDSPIQMANWPLFRKQLEACGRCAALAFLELPRLGHPALFNSPEARRIFNEFLAQNTG